MSTLRGFAPWIVYAVVSSVGWQWGALAALIVTIASLIVDRRQGVALDAQILGLSSLAFFVALTAFAFADPASPVKNFDGPLSFGFLALVAITSLLIRRPLTLGLARDRVTAEIADGPQFVHINMTITGLLAAAFTVSAVAGTITTAAHAGAFESIAPQVIAFVVPVYLIRRYIARVRRANPESAATTSTI
jgi:hypothetical protein